MTSTRRNELAELAFRLHLQNRGKTPRALRPILVYEEFFATRAEAITRRGYIKNQLARARRLGLPLAEWLAYNYRIRERPYAKDASAFVLEWKLCAPRKGRSE